MVEMARQRLKYKATHYPVGFELLPPKFTMPQLQSLYEAIFEAPIDKRNFIRRITALDILVKINEKGKGSAIVSIACNQSLKPYSHLPLCCPGREICLINVFISIQNLSILY